MASKHSHNDYNGDRERRDWLLLFLLLLLLGFICMLGAARMAINPPSSWRVSVDMSSDLNPHEDIYSTAVPIGPLRPEVMTPLWDVDVALTPALLEGTLVVIPTMVFGPHPTSTATPIPTPTATGTLTPTLTATGTHTPTRLP